MFKKHNFPFLYTLIISMLVLFIYLFDITVDMNPFFIAAPMWIILLASGIAGIISGIKLSVFLYLLSWNIHQIYNEDLDSVSSYFFTGIINFSSLIYFLFLILLLTVNKFFKHYKNVYKVILETAKFLVSLLLIYPIAFIALIFSPEQVENESMSQMLNKITSSTSLKFDGDFLSHDNTSGIIDFMYKSLNSLPILYTLIIILLVFCLFYPQSRINFKGNFKIMKYHFKTIAKQNFISNANNRKERRTNNKFAKKHAGAPLNKKPKNILLKNKTYNFFRRAVIPLIFSLFCLNIYLDFIAYNLLIELKEYIQIHQYLLIVNAMLLSMIALFSTPQTIRKLRKNVFFIVVVIIFFKIIIDIQNFLYSEYKLLFLHYFLIYFIFKLRDFILTKKPSFILVASFLLWVMFDFFIMFKIYKIENAEYFKVQIFIISMFCLAFFEKYIFDGLSIAKKIFLTSKASSELNAIKEKINDHRNSLASLKKISNGNSNIEIKKIIDKEIIKEKKEMQILITEFRIKRKA